jgi:hypothetical protein
MAQQKGATSKVVLGWEGAYAVAPAAGFVMPINSFSPNFAQNVNTPATLRGDRNPAEPFRGNWQSTFGLVVPADSLAMMYWLRAMFGAPVTTGAGPYVHEYKIGANQPSLTLESQFADLAAVRYFQYLGCKIASLSFSVGGDGELTLSLSGNGSYLNIATAPFHAAPTVVSLARLNNFQAVLSEGGANLANATEMSIEADFGHDAVRVIGGQGRVGAINEGIVGVSGSLTTIFEDVTLYNKALNATESSLKLTLSGGASSILEFEMEEVQYGVASPPIEGPQGLLVKLNYQAYYTNAGEASAIVARLTNGVAS